MHVAGEIPVRFRFRFAAEHPDRHPNPRKLLALELDRVDARDEPQRLMRNEIAVQERADVRGVAPGGILVIVRDQRAERGGIPFFRGELRRIDQGADLVFRRARRSAAGNGEARRDDEARRAQDKPPIAAGRR